MIIYFNEQETNNFVKSIFTILFNSHPFVTNWKGILIGYFNELNNDLKMNYLPQENALLFPAEIQFFNNYFKA